jgi:hypothetical protein
MNGDSFFGHTGRLFETTFDIATMVFTMFVAGTTYTLQGRVLAGDTSEEGLPIRVPCDETVLTAVQQLLERRYGADKVAEDQALDVVLDALNNALTPTAGATLRKLGDAVRGRADVSDVILAALTEEPSPYIVLWE